MYRSLSGKGRLGVFLLIDLLAVILSYFSAFFLRFDFTLPSEYAVLYFIWLSVFVVIKLGTFSIFGFYRGIWRYTSLWDIINIGKSILSASILITLLFGFSVGFGGFPRSIFLIDFILSLFLISGIRIGVRIYFSHFYSEQTVPVKVNKKKLKRLQNSKIIYLN